MQNKGAIIACIIGGILMLIASIVGNALAYRMIVDYASKQYPAYKAYLEIFLLICIIIAGAGGVSVIAGSIITFKIVPIGKWIIGLGAGMGLLGFIMWLVTGIIAGSITGTVLEIIVGLLTGPMSYGIIGVFLTVWARRFIKKKKEKAEETE